MRLFSEEDVLRLIGLAQVGEAPQDVIAEGERLGLVSPLCDPERAESIELEMRGCARCHGEHGTMRFTKLQCPSQVSPELKFTHWAICPAAGEPILYGLAPVTVFACER